MTKAGLNRVLELAEEAKVRYKETDTVISLTPDKRTGNPNHEDFNFSESNDSFFVSCYDEHRPPRNFFICVFRKGKWANILKKE